jgi:PhnB protein
MQLLNPYLHFDGRCEEAFNFYAKVLGGEIVAMMPHKGTPSEEHVPAEWRNKIIHARLMVGDKLLMVLTPRPAFRPAQGLLSNRGRR